MRGFDYVVIGGLSCFLLSGDCPVISDCGRVCRRISMTLRLRVGIEFGFMERVILSNWILCRYFDGTHTIRRNKWNRYR